MNGGQDRRTGHHECDVFTGTQPEAAESGYKWKNCQKTPGHKDFKTVEDFKDKYLPRVKTTEGQDTLKACIDLTVRLSVHYTSRDRPDGDAFSSIRGTKLRRFGTGFIQRVDRIEGPGRCCPCSECGGQVNRKHWRFEVRTALHVVFNTEEAKQTNVDLFFDDETCRQDGRIGSVWGGKATYFNSDRDTSVVSCVTHDEILGEKIQAAAEIVDQHGGLDAEDVFHMWAFREKDSVPVVIVSHPHGQPKKLTMGEMGKSDGEFPRQIYSTPTCAGSSGALVIAYTPKQGSLHMLHACPIHSGSYGHSPDRYLITQSNYGFWW